MKPLFKFPDHFLDFVVSIVFQLLIPLFPLGFEYWKSGDVSDRTTTLVAAMYAIAIGATSTSRLLFTTGVTISIVFSAAYGNLLESKPTGFAHCGGAALICIGVVFAYHALERFDLHFWQRRPFFLFAANPIQLAPLPATTFETTSNHP